MGNPFSFRNRNRDDYCDRPPRPKFFRWWPFKRSRRDDEPFTPYSANGSLNDIAPWSAPPDAPSRKPRNTAQDHPEVSSDPPGQRSRRPSYTPRYAARDALLSVPSSPAHVPRRAGSSKSLGADWARGENRSGPSNCDFVYNGKRLTKGGGRLYDPSMVGPWAAYHQGYGKPGSSSRGNRRRDLAHARSFSTEPNGVDVPAIPALPQDLAQMSGALPPSSKQSSGEIARASHCAQQGDDSADLERAWEMVGLAIGEVEEELDGPLMPPLPAVEGGGRRHVRASRSMGVIERNEPLTPRAWMGSAGVGRNFSRLGGTLSPSSSVAGADGGGWEKGKDKARAVKGCGAGERAMMLSPAARGMTSPSSQNYGPASSPPPRHSLPPVPKVDPPSAAEWFSDTTPLSWRHDKDDDDGNDNDAHKTVSIAPSTPGDLNMGKIMNGSLTAADKASATSTLNDPGPVPSHPSPQPIPPLPPVRRPQQHGDTVKIQVSESKTVDNATKSTPASRSQAPYCKPARPKRSDEKLSPPKPTTPPADSFVYVSARSSESVREGAEQDGKEIAGDVEEKGSSGGGGEGGWI